MPEMHGKPDITALEEEAIYLGVLTARGIKPLSRLEYEVAPEILDLLQDLGLAVTSVTRVAQNGARVIHWVFGRDSELLERYVSEFDGTILLERDAPTIRTEARYFGFPTCCAETYIRDPHAANSLTPEEQALLFHRACPGCVETPRLIPLYRSALEEARRLHRKLRERPVQAGTRRAPAASEAANSRIRSTGRSSSPSLTSADPTTTPSAMRAT